MSTTTTLKVHKRDISSRGDLRRIRAEGKIPGVIYGKGLESPSNVSIESKELIAMLKSHPNAVVEVDVPGAGKHPVMIVDLQRDSLSREVQHIDFKRINMNEKIKVTARLEVIGTSPGDKEGGMLQMVLHEIELECYPKDIPESIPVDVSKLGVGDHLTIADLTIPDKVAATQDPTTVIVAVLAPQKAVDEDAVDEAGAVESNEPAAEDAGEEVKS